MKKIILLYSFLLIVGKYQSQNNSYFNEFFDNSNFNSAYISQKKEFKTSFLGYKNLTSPYTPGYFNLNASYTNKDLLSFGIRLINKSYEFYSFYQADAIIGHKIALTQNDSISLAINVGGAMNTFDNNFLNQYTEIDPYIQVYTNSYFTSGANFLYTHKNKLELGASAPILATSSSGVNPIMYFNSAYNFTDNNFLIRPQVIFETNRYSNLFDFSAQLKYKGMYWAKFSYNTLGSSVYGIGVNLKIIDIGYAYKLNSDYYGKNQSGLHMLHLTIKH